MLARSVRGVTIRSCVTPSSIVRVITATPTSIAATAISGQRTLSCVAAFAAISSQNNNSNNNKFCDVNSPLYKYASRTPTTHISSMSNSVTPVHVRSLTHRSSYHRGSWNNMNGNNPNNNDPNNSNVWGSPPNYNPNWNPNGMWGKVKGVLNHFMNGSKQLYHNYKESKAIVARLQADPNGRYTRAEARLIHRTRIDLRTGIPFILFFGVPVIGNLAPILALFLPRFLPSTLWTPEQIVNTSTNIFLPY
jgi:hypothetical protein